MKTLRKTAIALALFLTLVMCFAFGASAEGEVVDGAFTYTVEDGSATITAIDFSAGDGLFIPAELGGYPVEKVTEEAFDGSQSIALIHFGGAQEAWDVIATNNAALNNLSVHLAETVKGTPAGCETPGLSDGIYCSDCDKWLLEQSETLALGHSFTTYNSDNNASIFADGTRTALCDNGCGKTDTVTDEGSKLAFGKPETVASTSTTSSITLSWTAVEGSTGYRIYYKNASGWKKCATLTGTSHTFSGLKPGSRFTFAVRAYNITGDVLTWAPSYTTFETSTQTEAPAKVTSTQNEWAIRLTWPAVKGATGYRVYIMTEDGWDSRGTTTKTTHTVSYELEEGTKYKFAVRPYIKTADTVIWSNYITYVGTTATHRTDVMVYKNEGASITIGLDRKTPAEYYRLYYKKSGEENYKLYKTYTEDRSFTFNLKGGDSYVFVIRAGVTKEDGIVWSAYNEVPVTVNYRIDRYNAMVRSGKFYYEAHDGNGLYNGTAVKNGYYCLEIKSPGVRQRVVYNPNNSGVYVIDDLAKKYCVYKDDGSMKAAVKEFEDTGTRRIKYKTTTETLGGKKYTVESYTEDGITLKYYFDGATLIADSISYDGETVIGYYSKFTKDVPNSLFTLGSGYKKVSLAEMLG